MGKKKKNKNNHAIASLLFDDRVLAAIVTGAAAGISLARILGIEKTKKVLEKIEDVKEEISDKLDVQWDYTNPSSEAKKKADKSKKDLPITDPV